MPKDSISVVQDLEDLLCHHITASTASDFVDELADILKTVLGIDRNTHWSIQSFLYDLREEYYRTRLTTEKPQPSRPHDDHRPRLNRSVVEPLSAMPTTHDIGPDKAAFALRYADQLYNVVRLQAKMPYKPFIEVLTENGFVKVSSSSALTTYKRALHDADDAGSSEHAQEYDASLLSRLSFLEDRVVILERREELLEGQLDRATQAMGALRSTNLDLAKKVSEVQQRNHDLRRTYAV